MAFGHSDAQAQSFNVRTFECADTFEVDVDIRGLGNTNICVVGSATVNLDCACVGGGGNCPRDANKQESTVDVSAAQTVEPKNGRVSTTVSLPVQVGDAQCAAALSCPSGQRARLIQFDTEPDGTFSGVCTTTAAAGQPCNCEGQTLLATAECDPDSQIRFSGRQNNCLALF